MNYPDVAPAFVAARAGYDVWLGNSRGNTFSKEFVSPVTEDNYWDFDWQE
jgi:lysosomal acid lipase/cholesteryl ester hydrolase